ncbi:MAG: methyltransferase domain-containing protein [Geobacteraceae bacterium]|nr:methyltransferase domain-containing protein [Geobacteraceae bacterium]
MKLNIGCGHKYLDGYLNVDAGIDSLADVRMDALDLQFASSTVDSIVASQLIEHLGFFKSRYFLAECFRVLRPGGMLRLETPDIERTFEVFLAGGRVAREAALQWVYGAESTGMHHVFCFPIELLREITAETGFLIQGEESYPYEQHRPAVRLILKKASEERGKVFFAELRKRMLEKQIPAFDDEVTIAGQEEILRRLASFDQYDWRNLLRLALHSAEIVREYFSLQADKVPRARQYEAIAAFLAGHHFQDVMFDMLKSNRAGAGCQEAAYRETLEQGMRIVDALADEGNIELQSARGSRVRVFLPSVIKTVADKTFAQGIKEYIHKRYPEAIERFATATAIFRDNPFPYWNAARIYKVLNNFELARQQYEMAWMTMSAGPDIQEVHRDTLAAEMKDVFTS